MYKLNSRIDRKGAVRIGNMVTTWCRTHMGLNNKKQYSILTSYKSGYDASLVGEYDPKEHEIIIYWNNIDNVKELIQTIIHEWTHSLQPLTSRWKEYNAESYSRNRFEKEAYDSEKRYIEVWTHIKHKLNK
jgi:hypothetical protein